MIRLKRILPALLCSAILLPAAAGQSPPVALERGVVERVVAPAPEVRTLRGELAEILRMPAWPDARYGVLIVSLDRGDTLFSHNPDLRLSPASNLKLYSTAAALYYLGPEFRYSTYLLADGPVRDGVLEGDLILYGTGDPAISGRMLPSTGSAFHALADSLAAAGIRRVGGDLVGDGSYFDAQWVGPGWEDDDRLAWYAAPVGALSFGENMVSVRVLPGAVGEPARVRTAPATEGLALINRVRTVTSGRTHIRFEHGPDGLVVSGQIQRRHPGLARSVPVVDPANFAAAAFRAVLEEKGITVAGRVRSVHDPSASRVTLAGASGTPAAGPPPRVLAVHLSPPLYDLVAVTNHVSHNLFAEALLKTVGRVVLGEGSYAAGARAVEYFLECETPIEVAALHLVDGSGLSKGNRVTPRATIELLDYMARSELDDVYHASLPEAGDPRGLRRMQQTPAAGNLRAKTGTIKDVSSLSGYVRAANGERLAFSIIVNDVPSTWQAKRVEDQIGARIAGFSRLTPLGEPAPSPSAEGGQSETAPEARGEGEEEAPAATPRTHRVRRGETLDGIARRYDVTVDALRDANPGVSPRRLQIGQRLRIPAG